MRIKSIYKILVAMEEKLMTREELQAQIDELMNQYSEKEIDEATYAEKMMELTQSAQNQKVE